MQDRKIYDSNHVMGVEGCTTVIRICEEIINDMWIDEIAQELTRLLVQVVVKYMN
jgi:hypothetical protein